MKVGLELIQMISDFEKNDDEKVTLVNIFGDNRDNLVSMVTNKFKSINKKVYDKDVLEYENDLLVHLKDGRIEAFQNRFNGEFDLIIIKEINLLENNTKIQRELFYTIEDTLMSGKKVITTSDFSLSELKGIEPALLNKLLSGVSIST